MSAGTKASLVSGGPYLLLDASAQAIQVGVLQAGQWRAFQTREGEALETLFALVKAVVSEAALAFGELKGFLHGAGPGSILGLRLAAMATETWRTLPALADAPLWSFPSLPVAAHLHQLASGEADFYLAAPFRGNRLHFQGVQDGQLEDLRLIELDELPDDRPGWQLVQRPTALSAQLELPSLPYDLKELPRLLPTQPALFACVKRATVCVPEAPTFARWEAQPHGQVTV